MDKVLATIYYSRAVIDFIILAIYVLYNENTLEYL